MVVTDFFSFVDGQVQVSAQVQPRPEFQNPGLRVMRPIRRVRLAMDNVLHRFNPDHPTASVQHAVDVRPIVFHVCVDAKSSATSVFECSFYCFDRHK